VQTRSLAFERDAMTDPDDHSPFPEPVFISIRLERGKTTGDAQQPMLTSMPTSSQTHHRTRSHSLRSRTLDAALLVVVSALVVLTPGVAPAQLRPLVADMLDNLNALNRIAEGLALEDWDQIEDASRTLRARAIQMRLLDLESLEMDRSQDAVWDAFLIAQEQAAQQISLAVRNQDSAGVLAAKKNLAGNACLGCHASFRDPQSRLRDSVLYMTSFLSLWRDLTRGLMVRDFDLIRRRAGELIAMTEIVGTDETLQDAFGLGGPRQRRIFRGFLNTVSSNADAMKTAAETKDLAKILAASNAMLGEGCVACHQKFRH
jgi:cytochrome c556